MKEIHENHMAHVPENAATDKPAMPPDFSDPEFWERMGETWQRNYLKVKENSRLITGGDNSNGISTQNTTDES